MPQEKVIVLPPFFAGESAIVALLAEVIDGKRPVAEQVVIDFSKLNWIEGDGATCLANLVEWCRANDSRVGFVGTNTSNAAIRYLDDSGFFDVCEGRRLLPASQARSTTLPLTRLTRDRSHAWLEHNLQPWLSTKLGLSREFIEIVVTCIYEMLNNVEDHSETKIGRCFAQWFPNRRQLDVTVSDFGIGIPEAMRTAFPDLSDEQALARAFDEGVTSKKKGRNLGLGLNTLATIIANNGGEVWVYSGLAKLHLGPLSEGLPAARPTNAYHPGTLITLRFRT